MELWRLVAHTHWITIPLPGGGIRICARCTGYLLGLITATYTIGSSLLTEFQAQAILIQWLIIGIFLTPFVVDWVGQRWGLHEGNNSQRLVTGFLMGFSLYLSQYLSVSQEFRTVSIVIIATLILVIGHHEDLPFLVTRSG
jgi:uncharacterized membrane protein